MQVFIITVPVTVAVFSFEIGRFVLLSSLVVVSVALLLILIVLPKVWLVRYGIRLFLTNSSDASALNPPVVSVKSPGNPHGSAAYDKPVHHSSPASHQVAPPAHTGGQIDPGHA